MLKYLTIVSQFPLYGCTKIFAHYRGIWPYGAETVLAVDFEGIKFISIQVAVYAGVSNDTNDLVIDVSL